MDDPLAGCSPICHDEGNGTNMLRSLLLRLRIFLEEKRSAAVGDQLVEEAGQVMINRYEYMINEVQFELRKCQKDFSDSFETIVLNNWVKDLLRRYPEDTVWTFFKVVRTNRENRKR